jgi:hypothetical protein
MGRETSYSPEARVTIGGRGVQELSKVQLVENGRVIDEIAPTAGRYGRTVPLDIRLEVYGGGPRNWDGTFTSSGSSTIVDTSFVPAQVTNVSDHQVEWCLRYPEFLTHQPASPAGACTMGFTIATTNPEHETVELSVAGRRLRLALRDLASGAEAREEFDGGRIQVRRGTGGLTGLGTRTIRHTFKARPVAPGHWYYTRVIQVDGEMAWTSPIWVD